MLERTHYDTLGITRSATQQEVRRAYLALARKAHPDKRATDESAAANSEFQRIADAYEVLYDESKRAAYDRELDAKIRARQAQRAAFNAAEERIRRAQATRRQRTRSGSGSGLGSPPAPFPFASFHAHSAAHHAHAHAAHAHGHRPMPTPFDNWPGPPPPRSNGRYPPGLDESPHARVVREHLTALANHMNARAGRQAQYSPYAPPPEPVFPAGGYHRGAAFRHERYEVPEELAAGHIAALTAHWAAMRTFEAKAYAAARAELERDLLFFSSARSFVR